MNVFVPRRAIVSVSVYEAIEAEIYRLIAILDILAPDPDLEPDSDLEPSLAWTDMEVRWGEYPADRAPNCDDREADDSDDEPSLGAPNVDMPLPVYRLGGGHGHCLFPMHREPGNLTYGNSPGFSQLMWGVGSRDDREDEHDGTEPCCEDEGAQCDD